MALMEEFEKSENDNFRLLWGFPVATLGAITKNRFADFSDTYIVVQQI